MTYPGSNQNAFNDTELAHGSGHDFGTAIRMIEERWSLYYPVVDYYPVKKSMTAVGQATDTLSGEPGTTKVDPLWGDPVDAASTTWAQPHLSETLITDPLTQQPRDAVEEKTIVRDGPFGINLRVQRTMKEDMLKKLGFDRVRTVVGTVPASMFERFSIRPEPGDRFRWNDEWYDVLQSAPGGWWKNTTRNLYWYLSVQSGRRGS